MSLTPEEQITLESYEARAKLWSTKHDQTDFWKPELDVFQTLLPQGKILEIGSGGGRDAEQLLLRGYQYLGTDVSSALIEIAKEKNPRGTFVHQSVYDLDFSDGTSFDGFWCSATLLHIPKNRIDEALQSIRRWIRPGGIGFISLKQGEGERLEMGIVEGAEEKRFFAYYQQEEFAEILLRNHFEIVQQFVRQTGSVTWLLYFVKI